MTVAKTEEAGAVSIEVTLEIGCAVIRCGRCGVETILWTRTDLIAGGLAAAFTETHLECRPTRG